MELGYDKEQLKKYYYALGVGGAALLGTILLSIVISQLYTKSSDLTKEAKVKTDKLVQLQKKKDILDELSKKEADLKRNAEALSTALPEDKDIGRLFIQLNGLITESGGSIKAIAGGNASETAQSSGSDVGATLKKYSFTLPVNLRNYETLKSLLTKTKNALRLMDVSSLSVSSPTGGEVDANVTINTYSRK